MNLIKPISIQNLLRLFICCVLFPLIVIIYNWATNSDQAWFQSYAKFFTFNTYPHGGIVMLPPESESAQQSMKQLVERQASAWQNADYEQIIADFAEDSLFIVPGAIFRGKPQIKQAAEDYFAKFTDTKIKIKRIIFHDNTGAIEWDWTDKNQETGQISQAEDAIVFEIEEGKIKYWREYIDKKS